MKVDCWLCQPAGTPIFVQIGRRLGVTCLVDIETDVLRPIHVCVERRVTRLTSVQATFNTLTIIFRTVHATRLARVTLGNFHDFDALDFRLVRENRREAVKCPPVQVEVAVAAPVLRLAVLTLSNTSELPDVDTPNATLNTLLNDMFG